jgi:hypothetical protein
VTYDANTLAWATNLVRSMPATKRDAPARELLTLWRSIGVCDDASIIAILNAVDNGRSYTAKSQALR